MDSTNNNNNVPSSKAKLGGGSSSNEGQHDQTLIRSNSLKRLELEGAANNSEQFVSSVKGEKNSKSPTYEKQQEKSNSQKSSLHRSILLATKSSCGRSSGSGGGGGSRSETSIKDTFSSDGWWKEENTTTTSSCLGRTTNPGGRGGNFVVAAVGRSLSCSSSSKEVKENLGVGSSATSSFATWELDSKIDSEERTGRFELEYDSLEKTTAAEISTLSSLHHHYHRRLAEVDPIVDFFTVDEELVGRFRICSSCRSRTPPVKRNNSGIISSNSDDGGSEETGILQQQQQAIIFKIKTTSPHSCWVRPIYGLMRPNVIAWVEAKCELKANSLAELVKNMEEFLVEICPVPGAIQTMTSDLYTNDVHSNLPELLNMWEVVEQELKENQQQLQGFVKEFHRVSCHFQWSSLPCSLQPFVEVTIAQQQDIIHDDDMSQDYTNEDNNNSEVETRSSNNVKNFQWNPFNSVQAHDECYFVAREFPIYNADGQTEKKRSTGVHSRRLRWEEQCPRDAYNEEDFGKDSSSNRSSSRACSGNCSAVRQLCCLVSVLTILLFALLVFIGYSQYYHNNYCVNNANSNSNNVKKNLFLKHAYNDKENINHDVVSSSTDIKRDFRK